MINNVTDFELKIPVNRAIRWICGFGIIGSLRTAFLTKLNNDGIGYFLFFIGMSLLELLGFLLSYSTIQVNQISITTTILFTKYRINWDEVEVIETDMRGMLGDPDWNNSEIDFDIGSTVVFLGKEKCFPIHLTALGKRRADFLMFLEKLINNRQLQVKPLSSALVRHKNTKVKQ